MLLSKLGLCVFRRLSGRMSMIDLFACLFAQHPTCHSCLSALCWWVRCSCPLLPAISSCGRGLLVCACVGLAGGLVWFGCFFPLFVGVVWSLRRPSAVCFLGVVVLASAAAAALHQCAVYLGAVHFTKYTHEFPFSDTPSPANPANPGLPANWPKGTCMFCPSGNRSKLIASCGLRIFKGQLKG